MTTSAHPATGSAPVPIRPGLPDPGTAEGVPTWRYLGFLLGPGVGTFAFNAVTVILPTLRERFGAGDVALELVIAGYGIPFAVLLILGGRLGDRFGRHRLYAIGMGLFLVSAIACALAPSIETLIAARVVQGVGAALCTPQVLGTIQATSRGAARTRAIAAFGASGGIGAAVGQVAGGALAAVSFGPVEGWRAVFVVVALIAVAAIVLAPLAPRSRAHEVVAIDLVGTAALALGILAASVALTFGPAWNWSWPVAVALLVAALALWGMWRHQDAIECSGRVPLLPPSVLRLRPLQLGLIAAGLFFAGYSALLYVFPRAVEAGGLTSLQAGMALLPFAVVFAGMSLAVARIQSRLGDATLILGVSLQIVALLAMGGTLAVAWGSDIGLWLQPALVILGAGQALIFSPLTQLVVREVPVEAAGLSGGMFSTAQQLALSFGVIVIGGLVSLTGAAGRDELLAGLALDIALAVAVLIVAVALRSRARRPSR
ncbi:permease of the major facilitator superfamily [Microbacterium testaceum StLB037]|uniref:Permease of the major facilitator superfamily n=1 Tax=Microbacterium testaceum (strain StLB037) TaxID=979556 RepID=E8NAT9_MICTS|nr:MFS transporter [Microbacterium testaceum]BAJ75956.1 permease of the major facilitator superfamily [Microbacterium testaceum StLB037]